MRDGYRLAFGAFDRPDAPKAQALKIATTCASARS